MAENSFFQKQTRSAWRDIYSASDQEGSLPQGELALKDTFEVMPQKKGTSEEILATMELCNCGLGQTTLLFWGRRLNMQLMVFRGVSFKNSELNFLSS